MRSLSSNDTPNRHWQISGLLALVGLLATATILSTFLLVVSKVDEIEHENARAAVENGLTTALNITELGTTDYAYWTLAHELIEARDADGVYEHLGSGAAESGLFDQLFILDSSGDLLFAYDEDPDIDATDLYQSFVYEVLLDRLRLSEAEAYVPAPSLLVDNGNLIAATAAWVTPDNVEADRGYPILIGVRHLLRDGENSIVTNGIVDAFDLAPAGQVAPTEKAQMALTDGDGETIGMLSWTLPSIAEELRNQFLPAITATSLAILIICMRVIGYFRAQHIALNRANKVARTDQLTGLMNRAGLYAWLDEPATQTALATGKLAVVYFDLNKFKPLNDQHGHAAGDIALRVTAERLKNASKPNAIAARVGGDEFVCVVLHDEPEMAARQVAETALDLAEKTIHFGIHQQTVSISVGISVAVQGSDWETVLHQADHAMLWAKQTNTGQPVVFCSSMDEPLAQDFVPEAQKRVS